MEVGQGRIYSSTNYSRQNQTARCTRYNNKQQQKAISNKICK